METENKISAANLIPNDKASQLVLTERAKYLSKIANTPIQQNEMVSYIRFRLGSLDSKEYYGIPYEYIQEVIDNVQITKLPRASQIIAGVINHRGFLLTVINLKKFLEIDTTAQENSSYIIVVRAGKTSIGILADNIEGSQEFDKILLNQAAQYQTTINSKYTLGLDQGMTAILNINAILLDLHEVLVNS